MIVVSKAILHFLICQRIRASFGAEDFDFKIIEHPGARPNWEVLTSDQVVQSIVSVLQWDYAIEDEVAHKQPYRTS
jgi:hypothetical protein